MKDYFDNIYKFSKDKLYENLKQSLINNKKEFIITANPEIFMTAKDNSLVSKMLLDSNNIIVPDGISIVKSARRFGINLEERITGVDLSEYLLSLANKYKKSVYLFGGKKEVVNKLAEIIKDKYPHISNIYVKDGYVKNKGEVFNDIRKKKADIVLVALGVPLQEEMIYSNINKLSKGIFVGVGGTFDVLSGTKKRAPRIFIKLNLEWLYRIIKEPRRLKRFFKYNIKFVCLVNKEKKRKNTQNNKII